uniref:Uncharacterized protein n=1 Tax=Timema poppense TaxID=170557 RepID=A0A7R9DX28_TIMPO|nr:unnamed protein product [Timema poppensis]
MTHETAGLLKEMVENHCVVVEMVDAGGDGIPVVNMYYKPQDKTDSLRCINTLLQGGAVTSNWSTNTVMLFPCYRAVTSNWSANSSDVVSLSLATGSLQQ